MIGPGESLGPGILDAVPVLAQIITHVRKAPARGQLPLVGEAVGHLAEAGQLTVVTRLSIVVHIAIRQPWNRRADAVARVAGDAVGPDPRRVHEGATAEEGGS